MMRDFVAAAQFSKVTVRDRLTHRRHQVLIEHRVDP